jgi:hypothetical protein
MRTKTSWFPVSGRDDKKALANALCTYEKNLHWCFGSPNEMAGTS